MSHTFRRSEVDELIHSYETGELTLDELAQKFRSGMISPRRSTGCSSARCWKPAKPRSEASFSAAGHGTAVFAGSDAA